MSDPVAFPDANQCLIELMVMAGDVEDFGVIDADTISCRYGDCCIRRHADGWEHARNGERHLTAGMAWMARRKLAKGGCDE